MTSILLIGVGAGLVTALLYGSIALGTGLSVLLFYLAPLPIYIAAFGWGTVSAAAAAATAIVAAGIVLPGLQAAAIMAVTVALPPVWFSHLALLSRPTANVGDHVDTSDGTPREWYPLGPLVVWTASVAIALVALAILILAPDAETFRGTLSALIREFLEAPATKEAMAEIEPEAVDRFVNFMVWLLPAASAVIYMLTSLFNMWLAARAVSLSGRLVRPEPAYSRFELPPLLAGALVVAIAGSFLPGAFGIVAGAAVACFITVYALLGLATLHVVTRPLPMRMFLLMTTYFAILFFSWIVTFALAAVGLAETVFRYRQRALDSTSSGGGPPGTGPRDGIE